PRTCGVRKWHWMGPEFRGWSGRSRRRRTGTSTPLPRDSDETWGVLQKPSDGALPDIEPHVAAAADGTIYVVWQAWQQGHSKIRMGYLRNGKWSNIIPVSEGDRNDWEPAIAAGPDGRAWIVWDRYN